MNQQPKDNKNIVTWKEYVESHPEILKKEQKKKLKNKFQFVCQCKRGHIFDYRNRTLYTSKHFAPCQGKCPECGSTFSFIGSGTNVYPIHFNFTG